MIPICILPLVLLPAAPASTSLGPAAESELRVYDMAALEVLVDANEGRSLVPATRANWADSREQSSAMGPERLTDLIVELFGDEFEYEDRGLWIDERSRLVVRGPAALQDQVARTIAFLESVLTTELELRVDRILLDASRAAQLTQDGIVTPAAAQELRALAGSGVRSESHLLRVRPGSAARVVRMREYNLVLDYDVEIAQAAAISDPIIGSVRVGMDLSIRAAPAQGGVQLAVLGQFSDAPDQPRRRENASSVLVSGESYSNQLDSPDMTQSVDLTALGLACNSFLPDGAALVYRVDSRLGGRDAGKATVELLVIERGEGELPSLARFETEGPSPRRLELLNAELFSPARCVTSGAFLSESRSSFNDYMSWNSDQGWVGAALSRGDYDSVAELLSDVGRSALDFDCDGPWILALDDPELSEQMRAAGTTPVSLEQDVKLLRETPVPLRLEAVVSRGGAEEPALRIVVPLRAGEECVLSVGREWIETWDYDVEVAQHSAIPDPSGRVGFDGMFLRARTAVAASGRLVLELEGEIRLLARSERFELGGQLMDAVEQSDYDVLQVSERLLFAPGAAGREPLRIGDPRSLALDLSVTR